MPFESQEPGAGGTVQGLGHHIPLFYSSCLSGPGRLGGLFVYFMFCYLTVSVCIAQDGLDLWVFHLCLLGVEIRGWYDEACSLSLLSPHFLSSIISSLPPTPSLCSPYVYVYVCLYCFPPYLLSQGFFMN